MGLKKSSANDRVTLHIYKMFTYIYKMFIYIYKILIKITYLRPLFYPLGHLQTE